MADFQNTLVYREEWTQTLQDRLSEPNKFKEICNVEYTDTKVLHNPYLTDATVQTGVRGCSYSMQSIVETDDNVSITSFKILPQFIDRADMAQSTFLKQMELADRQAVLLNEAIEAAVYADHASLTNMGTENLAGSTGSTQITVSVTNIDDIIRNMKTRIRVAGGETLMERNGAFIVWRPGDLEILEAFMQANGFNTADSVLKNGTVQGLRYMGVDHYSSNQLTANHVIGGVKKVYHLGILKSTYGQIMVDEKDPGQVSGISIVSRVDYKGKAWNKTVPVLFDINVA